MIILICTCVLMFTLYSLLHFFSTNRYGHPLPWIPKREGENEEKDVQTEEKEWQGNTHPLFQHLRWFYIHLNKCPDWVVVLQKCLDTMPVVVTSYEICMRDQRHLMYRKWRFLVVDEGHRIKNLNGKLIKSRAYPLFF